MLDRHDSARDKSIDRSVAEIGQPGMTRDCGLRNISPGSVEIAPSNVVRFPKRLTSPGIAPGSRSLLARLVRWRDNFVDVAFGPDKPHELPVSDLDERLRRSEQKKRQLQIRINALLGHD